jgi:hypothetical protein
MYTVGASFVAAVVLCTLEWLKVDTLVNDGWCTLFTYHVSCVVCKGKWVLKANSTSSTEQVWSDPGHVVLYVPLFDLRMFSIFWLPSAGQCIAHTQWDLTCPTVIRPNPILECLSSSALWLTYCVLYCVQIVLFYPTPVLSDTISRGTCGVQGDILWHTPLKANPLCNRLPLWV